MKKLVAYSLSTAMLLSASTSAFAAEPVMPGSLKINYGFEMSAPGADMAEEIEVLTDGELASGSVKVTVNGNGEEMALDLPNYVLASADGVYLNLDCILNLVETAIQETGEAGTAQELKDALASVGITTEWLEIIPIKLSDVKWNMESVQIEWPELDPKFMSDLQGIFSELVVPEVSETEISYVINNDTVIKTAGKMDAFKAEHLQCIGDFLSNIQNAVLNAENVDVKPAIAPYIQAIAEGIASVDENLQPENVKSVMDGTIDMAVNAVLGQAKEGLKAVPVADLWNTIQVKNLLENFLSDKAFEFRITMNEEGLGFSLTVGEQKVLSGSIDIQGQTITITLKNAQDQTVGSIEMEIAENGSSCTVKDEEGNVVSQAVSEVVVGEDSVKMNYDITANENDETMHFHGFMNMEAWENDGSLKVPEESTSILEVIKNVVAAGMQQAAQAQAQ